MNPHLWTLCFCLFAALPTSAATANKSCFDFTKPILAPLKMRPSLEKTQDRGPRETSADADWAWVAGTIPGNIEVIAKKLLDPKTIRDQDKTTIMVETKTPAPHAEFFEYSLIVKPIFFLTLKWKEFWAVTRLKNEILLSYEKTEGTSHIERFCGTYQLIQKTTDQVEVYFYQELRADRRDQNDILNDLAGSLKTLSP